MIKEINNVFLKEIVSSSPSKSFELRALFACLLANNDIKITNYGNCDDVSAMRNILSQFNFELSHNNNFYCISPKNIIVPKIMNAGESAFIARSLPSIMSLFSKNFQIIGKKSLLKRNIIEDYSIFREKKWQIKSDGNNLPASFSNAKLTPGKYFFDNPISSQVISGLLFSLYALNDDSEIIIKNPVSLAYIYLSIYVLSLFNVKIESENKDGLFTIFVKGGQKIIANNIEIEGDWSSAANFIVYALLKKDTIIKGLNVNSVQADKAILDVVEAANGKFFFSNGGLHILKSDTKSFDFDITHCPDIFPPLIILALFSEGKSKIYGINRLKNKESSRGEVLLQECRKMGAKIRQIDNHIEIEGEKNYKVANFNSYGDHRVAMAEIIISAILNNNSSVSGIDCVKKSCPNFLEMFY